PLHSSAPLSTYLHPLSLHDALPISDATSFPLRAGLIRPAHGGVTPGRPGRRPHRPGGPETACPHVATPRWSLMIVHVSRITPSRSEEHTSELQSPDHLVCRLLLDKK